MHDINDPRNQLDTEVVESTEMLGKECVCCSKILPYKFFARDASYRDGRRDRCQQCESAPRLSTAEHLSRFREMNYYSAAVKSQRWSNQEEYENTVARLGKTMHHSDFFRKIRRLVPSLYLMDGRIEGDISIFQTYPCPQPDLNGRSFRYLFYCPTGVLPEFSQYEFDHRDVPIKETRRGWRTVLLRLIKIGLVTEEKCNEVFGRAEGPASSVWYRKLYEHRNRKDS